MIAAASVVTANVPPGALVAGNPAKVIRHNVTQEAVSSPTSPRCLTRPTVQPRAAASAPQAGLRLPSALRKPEVVRIDGAVLIRVEEDFPDPRR